MKAATQDGSTAKIAINNLNLPLPIQYNVDLSQFTTFQLGGPCLGLVTCARPEQLELVLDKFISKNIPFMLIGAGSNIIVSDKGVNSYVIRYLSNTPLITRNDNNLIVTGSTRLDDVAMYCTQNGLGGLNTCSGIPGTLGGAIVGNAGAFGQQIGNVVTKLTVITKQGKKKTLRARNLHFTYRNSALKKTGDTILTAQLSLKPEDKAALQNQRREILKLREEKHPNLTLHPCAGSIFRNIEITPTQRQAAGKFLEEAGAKHLHCGEAKVFKKHANIIIKTSKKTTAQDVFTLTQHMAKQVKDKFNINLIPEVRFVGEFTPES